MEGGDDEARSQTAVMTPAYTQFMTLFAESTVEAVSIHDLS